MVYKLVLALHNSSLALVSGSWLGVTTYQFRGYQRLGAYFPHGLRAEPSITIGRVLERLYRAALPRVFFEV